MRMLKLSIGKGRQIINSSAAECCSTTLQWLQNAGYVLYRALVLSAPYLKFIHIRFWRGANSVDQTCAVGNWCKVIMHFKFILPIHQPLSLISWMSDHGCVWNWFQIFNRLFLHNIIIYDIIINSFVHCAAGKLIFLWEACGFLRLSSYIIAINWNFLLSSIVQPNQQILHL